MRRLSNSALPTWANVVMGLMALLGLAVTLFPPEAWFWKAICLAAFVFLFCLLIMFSREQYRRTEQAQCEARDAAAGMQVALERQMAALNEIKADGLRAAGPAIYAATHGLSWSGPPPRGTDTESST
jgi:hypothetical protein